MLFSRFVAKTPPHVSASHTCSPSHSRSLHGELSPEQTEIIARGLSACAPESRVSAAEMLERALREGSQINGTLGEVVRKRLWREKDERPLRALLTALHAAPLVPPELKRPLLRIAFKSPLLEVWTVSAALLHRQFGVELVATIDRELRPRLFYSEKKQQRALRLLGKTTAQSLRPLAATILLEQVRHYRRVIADPQIEARRRRGVRAHALVEALTELGGREAASGLVRCCGGANRHLAATARYNFNTIPAKAGIMIGEMYAVAKAYPRNARLRYDLLIASRNFDDELVVPFVVEALSFEGITKSAIRVRSQAVKTLRLCAHNCDAQQVCHIAQGLMSANVEARVVAAKALRALGDRSRPAQRQVLSALEEEEEARVLIHLVAVLHAVRTPDSHFALVSLSTNADVAARVRQRASKLLESS